MFVKIEKFREIEGIEPSICKCICNCIEFLVALKGSAYITIYPNNYLGLIVNGEQELCTTRDKFVELFDAYMKGIFLMCRN